MYVEKSKFQAKSDLNLVPSKFVMPRSHYGSMHSRPTRDNRRPFTNYQQPLSVCSSVFLTHANHTLISLQPLAT